MDNVTVQLLYNVLICVLLALVDDLELPDLHDKKIHPCFKLLPEYELASAVGVDDLVQKVFHLADPIVHDFQGALIAHISGKQRFLCTFKIVGINEILGSVDRGGGIRPVHGDDDLAGSLLAVDLHVNVADVLYVVCHGKGGVIDPDPAVILGRFLEIKVGDEHGDQPVFHPVAEIDDGIRPRRAKVELVAFWKIPAGDKVSGRRLPVFDDSVGPSGGKVELLIVQISGIAFLKPFGGFPHLALLIKTHTALAEALVNFRGLYGREGRIQFHVAVVGLQSLVEFLLGIMVLENFDQAKLVFFPDLREGFRLFPQDLVYAILGRLVIFIPQELVNFLSENADRAVLSRPFQNVQRPLVGLGPAAAVF